MDIEQWDYFLSIEADLAACARYVAFVPDNSDTFATEFARLIMASCAEIDAVAKRLCNRLKPGAKAERINDYRNIMVLRHSEWNPVQC
jgi:hypothetical protein